MLLAIAGNLVISIALIPFMLALSGLQLYMVIIALGASFGLLFELLVRGIENLEAKHHFTIAAIIPLIAIINVFFVANYLNNLEQAIQINNPKNAVIIAFVYSLSFIAPYAIYNLLFYISEKRIS